MSVEVDRVPMSSRFDQRLASLLHHQQSLHTHFTTTLDLLHLQYQLVDLTCPVCETTSIANGYRPSDITRMILPFATSINQHDLRFKCSIMGRVGRCVVIVFWDRPAATSMRRFRHKCVVSGFPRRRSGWEQSVITPSPISFIYLLSIARLTHNEGYSLWYPTRR